VGRESAADAPSLVTQPRRLGLLAYLALARPRGLHSRDTLVALFWPEDDQAHGRRALRNALHGLRRALGARAIVTAGDSLVGLDSSMFDCDVMAIELALAEGTLGDEDAAAAASGAATAETVRDRVLLEGFHVSGAPGFEHWLDAERERLRRTVAAAATTISQDQTMRGDLAGAVRAARLASQLDPDSERALRRLVEVLMAAGDRAQARSTYDAFVSRLEREFETAPAPATRALGAALRAPAVPTVPAGTAGTVAREVEILNVRGTYLFLRAAHGGHHADLERSRGFFEQALALDPESAPAVAGLSNYFASAAARNLIRPFETHFEHALRLSRRALALDPSLAIPHVHFGVQAMYLDDDWRRAGEEFREAVALDPDYAEARRFLGVYLGAMGRTQEAIAELRETVRREPSIAIFRNSLADALLRAGAYEEAIAELRAALEADPRYVAARERLVRCYERSGRYAEAIAERRFMGPAGRAERFEAAFGAEGSAGYLRERADELREAMRRLESGLRDGPPQHAGDRFNPPELRLALAAAELGDWEAAARWEERACRARPGRRHWFRSRPELQRR